jgi:hypothetical protein
MTRVTEKRLIPVTDNLVAENCIKKVTIPYHTTIPSFTTVRGLIHRLSRLLQYHPCRSTPPLVKASWIISILPDPPPSTSHGIGRGIPVTIVPASSVGHPITCVLFLLYYTHWLEHDGVLCKGNTTSDSIDLLLEEMRTRSTSFVDLSPQCGTGFNV